MKPVLVILMVLLAQAVRAQTISSFNTLLTQTNQVLFVKTSSADTIKGTLYLYERKNRHKRWKQKLMFPVTVGRSGLAPDANSAIAMNSTASKREGDGKSPAGLFALGNVFSYHSLNGLKMPFVQVDTNFYCVDDVSSSYYNTLIVNDTAAQSFNSFEHMKRKDDLYEYGVWVLYNSSPATPGNGSCIFLHVWRDENSATSGCTAMSKVNMLKLIYRLDQRKNPVLLQVVSADKQ